MTTYKTYKMNERFYLGQFDEDNKLIGTGPSYANEKAAIKKLKIWSGR